MTIYDYIDMIEGRWVTIYDYIDMIESRWVTSYGYIDMIEGRWVTSYGYIDMIEGRWVARGNLTRAFLFQRRCFAAGKVKVNGEIITDDYKVKNNDFITSIAHR